MADRYCSNIRGATLVVESLLLFFISQAICYAHGQSGLYSVRDVIGKKVDQSWLNQHAGVLTLPEEGIRFTEQLDGFTAEYEITRDGYVETIIFDEFKDVKSEADIVSIIRQVLAENNVHVRQSSLSYTTQYISGEMPTSYYPAYVNIHSGYGYNSFGEFFFHGNLTVYFGCAITLSDAIIEAASDNAGLPSGTFQRLLQDHYESSKWLMETFLTGLPELLRSHSYSLADSYIRTISSKVSSFTGIDSLLLSLTADYGRGLYYTSIGRYTEAIDILNNVRDRAADNNVMMDDYSIVNATALSMIRSGAPLDGSSLLQSDNSECRMAQAAPRREMILAEAEVTLGNIHSAISRLNNALRILEGMISSLEAYDLNGTIGEELIGMRKECILRIATLALSSSDRDTAERVYSSSDMYSIYSSDETVEELELMLKRAILSEQMGSLGGVITRLAGTLESSIFANLAYLDGHDRDAVMETVYPILDTFFSGVFAHGEGFLDNPSFDAFALVLAYKDILLAFEKEDNMRENEFSSAMTEDFFKRSEAVGKIRRSLREVTIGMQRHNADAAVEFFKYKDILTGVRYYCAVVQTAEHFEPKLLRLCSEDQLMELVGLGESLYDGPDAERLYDLVWRDIAALLPSHPSVWYSPAGLLNKVNFDAMRTESGHILCETNDLHRVSSTRQLCEGETDRSISTAVLYGGLTYDMTNAQMFEESNKYTFISEDAMHFIPRRTRSGMEPLPSSEYEVKDIASILKEGRIDAQLFIKEKGVEGSFKALSGKQIDIIHISTHGFFYTDEEASGLPYFNGEKSLGPMERSGLALSGAAAAWSGKNVSDGIDDGILLSGELAEMDLSGNQLTVLSACNTALGDVNEEGVFGLQRALKRAGAGSIVMTLWEVNDFITREFMTAFYKGITSGIDIHDAYRAAVTQIQEKYSEAAYWAAFVILD